MAMKSWLARALVSCITAYNLTPLYWSAQHPTGKCQSVNVQVLKLNTHTYMHVFHQHMNEIGQLLNSPRDNTSRSLRGITQSGICIYLYHLCALDGRREVVCFLKSTSCQKLGVAWEEFVSYSMLLLWRKSFDMCLGFTR